MRPALLVTLALLAVPSSSPAQIPNLPTFGSSWIYVGYPKVFYTARNGLTVGLYYVQFRPPGSRDWDEPPPYRASVAVDGQVSTSGSKYIRLDALFPNFLPGWRFGLRFNAQRRARQNYFGIGNATEFDDDNVTDAQPFFYQADRHRLFLRGELQRRVISGLRILAGFHFERWRLDTLPGPSLLGGDATAGVDPTIGVSTWDATARFGLVFDTRDDEVYPFKGVLLQAIFGVADSTVAGDLSYTRATVSAAGYLSIGEHLRLAGRVLGQALGGSPRIGSYYLVEASDRPFSGLGGSSSHRGLAQHRFLGEDILLVNLDARYQLLGERQVVTVDLLGFFDAGRVFQPGGADGEEFRVTLDGMHVGAGLGPVLTIGRTGVLGMTLGVGTDGLQVLAHTRWTF